MFSINDDTALLGIAELRQELPTITKELKIKKIIVMKKGKPVGVFEDYEQYQEKENLIETFEDLVLGYLAKERESKSKKKDYISGEKILKEFGVTL